MVTIEKLLEAIELRIHRFFRTLGVKRLLLILFTLMWAIISHAQTLDAGKLDKFFNRLSEKNEAMGSLMISKNGNKLYTRSIGYSHISASEMTPITMATKHRVGSITKMFTAVMILQLVEEGKLKLTDHLDDFLPEIPNAAKITIADILAHRSGIHDITADPDLRPRKINPITKNAMLSIISKGTPDFEPGTKYAYSNSGYFLLGYLVEKLTDKPYEEAIDERIISKIGLRDTYVATGNIDTGKNESFSYVRFSEWRQEPEAHASYLFGSGSLISTPGDLSRFIEALYDLKLISQESLNRMTRIRDGYGLGMDTFTFADKTFYGHTGGIDGFGSWLAYLPEEKLTIAYTANAKAYPVVKIVGGIIDICFDRPFQIPSFESIIVSPEILDKYLGVYVREGAPVKFTVKRDSSTLLVQITGQSATALEAITETRFKLKSLGMTIEFDTENDQMILKRGSGVRVFTKKN